MTTPTDSELLGRIHAALEQTNGKYGPAAEMLGMEREDVLGHVMRSAELRARWMNANHASANGAPPPDPGELANRDAGYHLREEVMQECGGEPTLHPDRKRGEALMGQECKLIQKGVEGLRLSERALDRAIIFQNFSRDKLRDVLQIALADSVTRTLELGVLFEDFCADIRKIQKKLEEHPDKGEERDYWIKERTRTMKDFIAVNDSLRMERESNEKGLLVLSLVKKALKDGSQSKKKPKFGESDVSVLEADSEKVPA